ncbi:MAG: XdhC family aldehyde oxidoreductase maturation factor [Syntrophobacteraceae bacterium]|jgi:xanthine dehydrogenase accessory factor
MNVFKGIAKLLSEGESVVLATILDRSGSAPRSVGSRMAVRANGSILGTVGGGVLEARVQDLASEVFKTRKTMVRKFTLTAEDASRMGMICGGQVRILIDFLDASEDLQGRFYNDVVAALDAHRQALLVTLIPGEQGDFERPVHGLIVKDGSFTGTLDPALVREVADLFGGRQPDVVRHGEQDFFVEPLCRQGSVFIFGAGHIGRELAPLSKLVGFRTIVVDDRQEFANRARFPSADAVLVLDSFANAMNGLNIDEESCLVIVTRGHAHDKTVLGLALATKAGYIGMIGSRKKRDAVYEALIEEGFTRDELERVHCPVGLDIKAETPEEIAVSIAAELIQARAGKS